MSVIVAMVEALERLGGPDAVAHLEAVATRPTWLDEIRTRSLTALDRLGARGIGRFLQQLATEDPIPTKVYAIEGTGVLRDTTAVPLLLSAFSSDRGSPMRLAAAWSLARLGAAGDIGNEVQLDLDHANPGYQARAAEVIGLLGDDRWTPPLARKLTSTSDPAVRAAVVNALAAIGSDRAVEALRSAYDRSKQIDEKASLVLTLGRIDRKRARDELVAILTDSEYLDIRLAATDGLGVSGDLRHLQVLLPLLADPAPEMRLQAAAAILRLTRVAELPPAG